MNMDQLANLAEILGGIAVISSLIYVGAQIRQNTRATQAATTHELTKSFNAVVSKIVEDPEMARIWTQQSRGMANLSVEDLQRLVPLTIMILRTFEDIYQQHHLGQMHPDIWAGWKNFMSAVACNPGIQHQWQERSFFYSPGFQHFMEELELDDRGTGLAEYIDKATSHIEAQKASRDHASEQGL